MTARAAFATIAGMNTHGPLNIDVFVEPSFQENGLLLWPKDGSEAWIIDPGYPPQPDEMLDALDRRKLTLDATVLTHCHLDHLGGVNRVCERQPDASLWAPEAEEHMLGDPDANLSGPFGAPVTVRAADRLLRPGETLTLGPLSWSVLDVSGHSPGGLAFYCTDAGVVIVGDALFAGSIGRHDFPGSSGERLLANIRANLLTLPPETVVYSGHGPETTIGREAKSNPFLLGAL